MRGLYLFFLFFIILAAFGCATTGPVSTAQEGATGGPEPDFVSIDEFRRPYELAWLKDPDIPYDRRLIHQAVPGPRKVVLWYLLGASDIMRGEVVKPKLKIKTAGRFVKPNFELFHFKGHHTGRIEISSLRPGTEYEIRFRLFEDDRDEELIIARTAPGRNSTSPVSFLAYSCLMPYSFSKSGEPIIYNQTVNLLNRMRERAVSKDGPAFMLGIGDQFYVDAGASTKRRDYALLYGERSGVSRASRDDYPIFFDELYRRHLALPPFDEAHRLVPTAMMWDDHEIRDGWGSQGDEESPGWVDYYKEARAKFIAFQGARNPLAAGLEWEDFLKSSVQKRSEELYTSFDWGRDIKTFMLDMRSARDKGSGQVISRKQEKALERWLKSAKADEPKLFVIVSGVPLFIRSSLVKKSGGQATNLLRPAIKDDAIDAWDSVVNRKARERLLVVLKKHFEKNRLHKFLILSGNDHYSAVIYITDKKKSVLGHEVLTSGLAQGLYDYPVPPSSFLTSFLPDYGSGLRAYPREHLTGPHFVELFVTPDPVGATLPLLELSIYSTRAPNPIGPITTYRLSNLAGRATAPRIVLLYDKLPPSCIFDEIPYNDIAKTNTAFKFTSCVTDIDAKGAARNWFEIKGEAEEAISCRPYKNRFKCYDTDEWVREFKAIPKKILKK